MGIREAKEEFKRATWSTEAEVESFVAETGVLSPADIVGLLQILVKADPGAQAFRCLAFRKVVDAAPSRDLFQALAQGMGVGDALVRETCEALLPKCNNPEAHGALVDLLDSDDGQVRKSAAALIATLGGPQALAAVMQRARDPKFKGLDDAMRALVPKAKHRALPLLQLALGHESPYVRANAVRYAGQKQNVEQDPMGAAKIVLYALDHDSHSRVKASALESLGALVNERSFFARAEGYAEDLDLVVRCGFLRAMSRYPSHRAINALSRALRLDVELARIAAIEALEQLGVPEVLPVLVEGLADERLTIRNKALDALITLGKTGRVDVGQSIVWLLKSRDVNIRRQAAELARGVGKTAMDIMPSLLRHLCDEDWWVRERVIDTLIQIAGKKLTVHVVDLLNNPSNLIRRFAVGALQRLKDPESLGALVRVATDDADWWVREQAISTIGDLADKRAIPYLMQMLFKDPSSRIATIGALEVLDAVDATPFVAEALSAPEAHTRASALRFLAKYDDKSSLQRVQELALDEERIVRDAAELCLKNWTVTIDVSAATARDLDELDALLVRMAEAGADDLILHAGRIPQIKKLGRIEPFGERVVSQERLEQLITSALRPDQIMALHRNEEVDYSHSVKSHGRRFRANLFKQMTGIAAVYRTVRTDAADFDSLGLPPIVKTLSSYPNGLVLIGGPTGSGKSTTLASLIHHINMTESRHILTLEDPIETIHRRRESLINQRELGTDALDFTSALRATLRQDPDVILVGEMRDLATITFAVEASETGHLVFGTVHTSSAAGTVDRLLSVFTPAQRPKIRSMLSETLRAVVCQHLVRRSDQPGKRCLAVEIMIMDEAIQNLIRKDKAFQIPSAIATRTEKGMQTMDQSLASLVQQKVISREDALMKSSDAPALTKLLDGTSAAAPSGAEELPGLDEAGP